MQRFYWKNLNKVSFAKELKFVKELTTLFIAKLDEYQKKA